MDKILASSIAKFLHYSFIGDDIEIKSFSQLSDIKANTIVFAKKYKDEFCEVLNSSCEVCAIVVPEYSGKLKCSYIISNNPRLDYIKVLTEFFEPVDLNYGKIHPSAVIEPGAIIGTNITIGAHVYISSRTIIGDNCIIHPNVTIDNIVTIGNYCEIKSGTVIGQSGFGYERNKNGVPTRFPHLGSVRIGNNVSIGANNTVDRATLGETIIEDNVKTDNLVHIAHNDHIMNGTLLTAGAIFSGGVTVGKNSWVAPNTCFMQQITLGDESVIGLGAVVLKDVEAKSVMVGNPAKALVKK